MKGTYKETVDNWQQYSCVFLGPENEYKIISAKYITGRSRGIGAHRLAFYMKYGYWADYTCHHCDKPGCVQPMHLFNGNAKENAQDMARKGRGGIKRGPYSNTLSKMRSK